MQCVVVTLLQIQITFGVEMVSSALKIFELLGTKMAVQSADNFRKLRKKGITIRKTADVIIASFCIEHHIPLLFSDKDFKPFVEHLGLCNAI